MVRNKYVNIFIAWVPLLIGWGFIQLGEWAFDIFQTQETVWYYVAWGISCLLIACLFFTAAILMISTVGRTWKD